MKNGILYRCLETRHYLCTIIQNKMGINKLKVVLTEEAQAFLDAQPFKAQQKIYYNIFKVEEGVMKVDIFKNWKIPRYGSFELSTMVYATGFSPFGIQRKRLWLLLHMA